MLNRTVKKIEIVRADFDEHLWPVNVALGVLGGCVAGVIFATSDFTWPPTNLFRSGQVRFVSLLGSMVVLMVLASLAGGARGRRLQLAALVSVMIHLIAAGGLSMTRLNVIPTGTIAEVDSRNESKSNQRADYALQVNSSHRERPVHEEPLALDEPEVTQDAKPAEHSHQTRSVETRQQQEIAQEATVATVTEIPRSRPSAARQVERTAQRSRQTVSTPLPTASASVASLEDQPVLEATKEPLQPKPNAASPSRQVSAAVARRTEEQADTVAPVAVALPQLDRPMSETLLPSPSRLLDRAISETEQPVNARAEATPTTAQPTPIEAPSQLNPAQVVSRPKQSNEQPLISKPSESAAVDVPNALPKTTSQGRPARAATSLSAPLAVKDQRAVPRVRAQADSGDSQSEAESISGTPLGTEQTATDSMAASSEGSPRPQNSSVLNRSRQPAGRGSAIVSRESGNTPAGPRGDPDSNQVAVSPGGSPTAGSLSRTKGNRGTQSGTPSGGFAIGTPSRAKASAGSDSGTDGIVINGPDVSPTSEPPGDGPPDTPPVAATMRSGGRAETPLQTVQGVARGKNASPGDELIEVSLTPTPTSRPDRNEQQNTQTASAGNRPERATVGPMREDESKTVSVKPLEESPTEAPGTQSSTPLMAAQLQGRQSTGGSAVVMASAPEGPGGTDDEPGPQPGVLSRSSRSKSSIGGTGESRFLARASITQLPIQSRAREPAKSFEMRARGVRNSRASGRLGPESEEAIERGLEFLVRAQLPDGRWSLSRFPGATETDSGSIQSDTAATGLALLSFLGAGYDHYEERHRDTVRRGLEFLVSIQKPDGDLFLPADESSNRSAWLYSHGIAAIALCEAVGMTGDPLLHKHAQKACDFIVATQHPERGGWRYSPGVGSDLSVSGWMLVAIRSGQLAGLSIDPLAYEKIRLMLDQSHPENNGSGYAYNIRAPNTPEQRAGRSPTPSMTAVGLLMRLHTGWSKADERVIEGTAMLSKLRPSVGTRTKPTRDCYHWYYAAQVLYHVGGPVWKEWYTSLHDLLLRTQAKEGVMAGSWNPAGGVPDRWGAFGGRIYVTTLNLLTLEVNYRHLPIYDVLESK